MVIIKNLDGFTHTQINSWQVTVISVFDRNEVDETESFSVLHILKMKQRPSG